MQGLCATSLKDRLFNALKRSTADYAEVRVETEEATRLAYRGREMETAGTSSFCGGIVRACVRGGWGVIAFDSIEEAPRLVEEACLCARLVADSMEDAETTDLAETAVVDASVTAHLERDFRGVSLDEKIALVQSYNNIILGADPRIETSMTAYMDAFRTVYFASTRGNFFMEERPKATCVYVATARDGSLIQRAFGSVASARSFDAVVGLEDKVREVADRSKALLSAPKMEGGPQTIVLNPLIGGVFIHEAFGHLSEADFLHENPQMRDLMTIGRPMGVPSLNVVDDGSRARSIGSLTYDDEGTPTGKTYLIREGKLAGHLHSLETAAKMGAVPTGNARAVGRHHPPIVRMTNTYIENGDVPVDEIFSGVDNGLYACDAFGGQTEFEMFTFSAAYGHRIENGEKGELVRDIVLTGNVFETLNKIDAIGDDLKICEEGGGCGKGGQAPLPTAEGAPHIRIQDVVVGGQ